MARPSWLRRAARNRHRRAIEQASRRWRGGRIQDERAVNLISTQAIATNDVAIGDVARTALEELEKGIKEASDFEDELFEEFDRLNQPPESAYAWID